MIGNRLSLLCAASGVLLLTLSLPATAGPKVVVGHQVATGQRVPFDRVDHAAWNALLGKYVDDAGLVNYLFWQRTGDDVAALDRYLNVLSRADPSQRSSREGQLAFWINAYNALTIKGILREYPTSSIRNHTARFFGYNIWHDLLLIVGDRQISLDAMEHKILRPMGEPRIHFAIVCASRSCPRLLNEAYTAEKLEHQLAGNTRAFFADQDNFRYRGGRFYLSPILKWFAEDFGDTEAEVLRAISPYLPDATSREAAAVGTAAVTYLEYNWSLNGQATGRTSQR